MGNQDPSYVLRPATKAERLYCHPAADQIEAQAKLICYFKGHYYGNGDDFSAKMTSWDENLESATFRVERNLVLAFLTSKDQILENLESLRAFCQKHPESYSGYLTFYDFRMDTEKYSYLFSLVPDVGNFNVYCYVYVKNALDQHMKNAEAGIRFVTPDHKELFRIEDGESICVKDAKGEVRVFPCRYVDENHLLIGLTVYHICEFAERMRDIGATVSKS